MEIRPGLLVFALFTLGQCQRPYECPSDWVSNDADQKCYKFVYFPELTYEKATMACAVNHRATLISINSLAEFNFINGWLQNHDALRHSWYTSGERRGSTAMYDFRGDNTAFNLELLNVFANINSNGDVLIIKHYDFEYRLGLSSASLPLSYICEIDRSEAFMVLAHSRDFLFGTTASNIEDVEYGPETTEMPGDLIMLHGSTLAYLECRAKGNPRPSYTWLRGANFTEVVSAASSPSYTFTNGKMTIQDPEEERDAGMYRCRIENKFGIVISPPIQISFAFMGDFSNVKDAPITATAFDGAVIQCSHITFKPSVVYNWQRQSYNSGKKEFIYTELTPYMFISANGQLYFSETTIEDQGTYFCQTTLSGLSPSVVGSSQPPSKTSLEITLLISDTGARTDFGPTIHNDFINVFPSPALRGQDVQLECFAYGTARNYLNSWRYTWTREGQEMPPGHTLKDHNRVLVIPNAQREDEGTYTCTVRRGQSASDKKSVTLKLESKPYFLVPLRSQHLDEGYPLTWRCQVGGNPLSTYAWYKNGKHMTGGDDIQIRKNVLIITSADARKHDGMYQCSATNIHGTTMSGAQIRVLGFPPTFRKAPLPSSKDAALNGNITIECDPEAAPHPEFTWRKTLSATSSGGIEITSSGRIQILSNGHLLIAGVQYGDAGYYTCMATNKYGDASSTALLNVRAATVIGTPIPKLPINLNETAFLPCEASFDNTLDLIYIWMFNGRKLDFQDDPHYAQGTFPKGLYIKNAQFQHAGDYECVAQTPLNSASRTGGLIINGPPGEVAGVYADSTSVTKNSIVLNWFPGKDNGRPIEYYIIQAEAQVEPDVWTTVIAGIPDRDTLITDASGTEMRTTRVTNLDPFNGYRFRVQAANVYGLGPFSRPALSVYYQTKPAAPSRAPTDVSGGGGSVGDLVMKWKPLHRRYQGGPTGGYYIYWRRWTPNAISLPEWSFKKLEGWDHHEYVELVGTENYYLEYEIQIQAYNGYGRGPNSTAQIIYSAEGMPVAAPKHVFGDGYNSTAMTVTWVAIPNTREAMKGVVRGYQINYWPLIHTPPPRKQFIRHPGNVDSGLVIGLWADSYFWFEVQVYNSAGLGPVSEKYQMETKNPAPFLYPQEVMVHSYNATAVKVTWRGISTSIGEDTLRGYTIYFWQASENVVQARMKRVDKMPTVHYINQLERDVVYAIRIAGHSGGGIGKKSPTVFFTLGGMVYVDPTVTEIRASASLFSASSALTVILFYLSLTLR